MRQFLRKFRNGFLATLCLAPVISAPSLAATINVPSDQPTIQAGIDAAVTGDTVLVGPGTYDVALFVTGKAIKLLSSDGPAQTMLRPVFSGSTSAILVLATGADSSTQVSGFTFFSRTAVQVRIQNDAEPTISRNIFTDSTFGGSAIIEIISTAVDPLISRNIFADIVFGVNAVSIWSGSARIFDNTLTRSGKIATFASGIGTARNNIIGVIRGNFINSDYNNVIRAYENGAIPGPNDISADPLFNDPANLDFRLAEFSPCINAADPDPALNDPDGSRNDMGALTTIDFPAAFNLNIDPLDSTHVVDSTPEFNWSWFDNDGSQTGYEIQVGTDDDWTVAENWSSGVVTSTDTSAVYAGAPLVDGEDYFYRIRSHDGPQAGEWRQSFFHMNFVPLPLHFLPVNIGQIHFSSETLVLQETQDPEGDTLTYEIELYTDAALTSLAFSESGLVAETSLVSTTAPLALTVNTTYWWRARSFDGFDFSAWSIPHTFFSRDGGANLYIPADFPSISLGINYSGDGDTLTIAPGLYRVKLRTGSKKLSFIGGGEPGDVVLQPPGGGGCDTILIIESGQDSTSVVSGFVFQGGKCSGLGRQLLISNSSPTIRGNIFSISFDVLIETTNGAHPTIERNVMQLGGNHQGDALIIGNGGALILNNTIHNVGASIINSSPLTVFKNNIISDVTTPILESSPTGFLEIDYNNVWNSFGGGAPVGANSISADPVFRDPGNGDFSLSGASPCIDAGDPNPNFNDPDNTQNDIGAFYRFRTLPFPELLNLGPVFPPRMITFTPTIFWSYVDTTATQTAFEIEVGSDLDWSVAENWSPGPVFSSDTSVVYAGTPLTGGTDYYARVRVFNGSSWGGWAEVFFHKNDRPSVGRPSAPLEQDSAVFDALRLKAFASFDLDNDPLTYEFELYSDPALTQLVYSEGGFSSPAGIITSEYIGGLSPGSMYWHRVRSFDGWEFSEWSDSVLFHTRQSRSVRVPLDFPLIRTALVSSAEGDTILVSSGNYPDFFNFNGRSIKLIGVSNPTPPVLNGGGIQFGSVEDSLTLFSGFTITGIDNPMAAIQITNGSSPEISGNFFISSLSSSGPAILVTGDNSQPIIRLNLFQNNLTGIEVDNSSSPLILNNTFDMNDIGVSSQSGSAVFSGNIVTNSSGAGITGEFCELSYNDIWNNTPDYAAPLGPGLGSISADPLFADPTILDYFLLPGSPAINAGNPDPAFNDPDGSRNDMGAFPGVSLVCCIDPGDANDDGSVNIADITFLIA
ncbi:MAG: right-handed parallel beta-helix repeat-containing protein, partial [candidate division Zixibacteria bacterium]|nr:right-handed parallel beta-helix repeat-containing protein [candidate division Zixibacteria bacterium]